MPQRIVTIDVAPGLSVRVIESADPDAVLAAAAAGERVDPYSSTLWPSAIACARELVPALRPGMTVLDIGAGTGLCSLTAALLGATAIALDHDPDALARLERSAQLNGVHVTACQLDVTSSTPLPACDVAVIADLLYQLELSEPVARRATEAADLGARVLVADPGRIGQADFLIELARAGWGVELTRRDIQLAGAEHDSHVWLGWLEPLRQGRAGDA